jgi:hypothetical protein
MRLPFGLDLKSMIVAFLLAYLVIPFVMSKVNARRAEAAA